MPNPSNPQIRALYKQFMLVHRNWPAQTLRRQKFRDQLLDRVRKEFRAPVGDDLTMKNDKFEHGIREIEALNALLRNEFEQADKLDETGPIRTALPPPASYSLLDVPAQEALSEKNTTTWTFIGAYLAGRLSSTGNTGTGSSRT